MEFKYEDFVNKGTILGEGSFKRAYRLGDYVMCVPKDEDKWSRNQVKSQIDFWLDSDDEAREILNPIIQYDYDKLYYISPYCSNIGKSDMIDYRKLEILCDETSGNCLYYEDLVVTSNQGMLNGKVVLIDYGLKVSDFYQWKLDTEGLTIDMKDTVLYAGISDVVWLVTIRYIMRNNEFHILQMYMDFGCEETDIFKRVHETLEKTYTIVDDRKVVEDLLNMEKGMWRT